MSTRVKSLNTTDKELFMNKRPEDFSTFPEKIKCARINYRNSKKSVGLSLISAAKQIGMSSVYLWELENGKKLIPNSVIMYKIETFYRFKSGELTKLLCDQEKKRA